MTTSIISDALSNYKKEIWKMKIEIKEENVLYNKT